MSCETCPGGDKPFARPIAVAGAIASLVTVGFSLRSLFARRKPDVYFLKLAGCAACLEAEPAVRAFEASGGRVQVIDAGAREIPPIMAPALLHLDDAGEWHLEEGAGPWFKDGASVRQWVERHK